MFTWRELIDMGLRQRGYWLKQADAIRRQNIATIVHGVGIGMADKDSHQKAVDELELNVTVKESRKRNSEATWGLMKLFGGGKGV